MTEGVVRVKRLSPMAKLPKKAHVTDSGYDICASESFRIEPGKYALVKTDIAVQLPEGFGLTLRPRSGLSAKGILNALGTIDNGYIGEIKVNVFNHSDDAIEIFVGDRIGQIVVERIYDFKVVEVEDFDVVTDRGDNGFGSTGVK